ncbi:MAG: DUF4194 domain-containing protein [Candidatus Thiodiazotropha endolucinida]
MIKDLKTLLDADEELDEAELKQTAQMLLARQFLLRHKPRHRRHYDRVVRYQKYYRNLMDALNHQLVINENHGYVGITPDDFVYRMKLEETLILLALRYIYDEELNAFNLEDDGSVLVSVEDFEDRYLQLTQRDMPKTSTVFREYLKDFANHGILDTEQDELDPRVVRIRIYPTISELLSGNMIERVAGYLMAEDVPVVEKLAEEEREEQEQEQEQGREQP